MKLSDLDLERFGITLSRDGNFDTLGSFSRKRMKNLLVFIDDNKYIPILREGIDRFQSVICTPELQTLIPSHMGVGVSNDPGNSFYTLHNYLARVNPSYHVLPESDVSPDAHIHKTAFIDTNVKISEGCVIHPGAVILKGTILKEDVIIGPGSVIGGEGFRFLKNKSDNMPITHVGGVLLERGVEIQANSCVDKAVYADYTIIGEYTKIDNLVHVGHNVEIGKRCLLVACSMIGGSTVIGDDVWVGPNVSVSDNLLIGDSAFIPLGSVVTRNIPSGTALIGNTVMDSSKFFKFIHSNKRGM